MALDLGTLGVRVQATVGDSINKLNQVKDSLEGISDGGKLTSTSLSNLEKMDFSNLLGNLGNVKGVISSVASSIGNLSGLSAVVSVVTAAGEAVSDWISDTDEKTQTMVDNCKAVAQAADETITNATKTGLSTEWVQIYTQLAGITDTEWSTIEGGISKIGTALSDTDSESYKKLAAACEELGVALVDENGNPRIAADIFNDLVIAFQQFPGSEAQKNALACDVFGKSYQDLLPLLNTDTSKFEDSVSRLKEMHGILDNKDIEALGALSDALEWLSTSESALKQLEAVYLAKGTQKQTEAETIVNEVKTEVLSGEGVDADKLDEASTKQAEGNVETTKERRRISDTEEYIDDVQNVLTAQKETIEYFENALSGGDLFDFVHGFASLGEGLGASLKEGVDVLLDVLGIKNIDTHQADYTFEDDNKTANEAAEEVQTAVGDSAQIIEDAIPVYEGLFNKIEALAEVWGIEDFDYTNLPEQVKESLASLVTQINDGTLSVYEAMDSVGTNWNWEAIAEYMQPATTVEGDEVSDGGTKIEEQNNDNRTYVYNYNGGNGGTSDNASDSLTH